MKTTLKLKINPKWEYLGLIYLSNKTIGRLLFLIKSRETIPLRNKFFILKLYSSEKNIFSSIP
jgi:hypothetical protein